VLDFLFQKTPIIAPKNESISQEIHLKIPPLTRGLKLSISKPGCRVSAHSSSLLSEIGTTNGFLASSLFKIRAFSSFLFPGLTSVSLLESDSGFEIFMDIKDSTSKRSTLVYGRG
jgi:hypothetical protein